MHTITRIYIYTYIHTYLIYCIYINDRVFGLYFKCFDKLQIYFAREKMQNKKIKIIFAFVLMQIEI